MHLSSSLAKYLYPLRACTFTYIYRCPIKSTHLFYTYIQCYTYIVIFENVLSELCFQIRRRVYVNMIPPANLLQHAMLLKSFWLPGYTSEIMSFSTILAALLDLPLKGMFRSLRLGIL